MLAPGGYLSFSGCGPDTLRELRQSWASVDRHSHVNQFFDMHDVGDALVRAGFVQPVLDVERWTLQYTDVRSLARDLQAVGARNCTAGRARGLTGRGTFAAMNDAYERFRVAGRLAASCEVVFGQAWGPVPRGPRGDVDSVVSLDEVKRQLGLQRRTAGPSPKS